VIPGGTPSAVLNRAVGSPLVRGGLTLVFGVLTGNAIGFARVALTAYLLGTDSRADALAVAMGPIDTVNAVLINSFVFAFVPMLTARGGPDRAALFLQLSRWFLCVSAAVSAAVVLAAPLLMRALAPGLDPAYFDTAVAILRILALSTTAAGAGAVQCALLYTARRFAPTAFYQAALNASTIVCALALWRIAGVYAFAIGYTAGAWLQLAIVWHAARQGLDKPATASGVAWRDLLARPSVFMIYAAGLGANIVFTRAWATHAGPGMAAALDYSMRLVGVPLAILVGPISNSLLPEIARRDVRGALRLIDRTVALAALAAVAGCAAAVLFRDPLIAILFQRGSFTADSSRMVAAVLLGFAPSLIGWSLLEIAARSLFAMNRPWPPIVVAPVPLLVNVLAVSRLPGGVEWLGAGSSIGFVAGFAMLYAILHTARKGWSVAR
jgi:putative peptidoglycan lipid II flippase